MTTPDANRVLFICTGNYYRSRLAEILFNYYAKMWKSPFVAESRGLIEQVECKGVAREVVDYLKQRNIPLADCLNRDPIPLRVEDTEKARLIIGMCRDEHQTLLKERYPGILKLLEQEHRIRFWNIDDVPERIGLWKKIFSQNLPCQRAVSGTEHIDFAVRVLFGELVMKEEDKLKFENDKKSEEDIPPLDSEQEENKSLKVQVAQEDS